MEINKEFWKDKRVFCTGSTGFVGTHLTNKLVSLGAKVKLFIHNTRPSDMELMGYYGDLTYDHHAYGKFLLEYQPDIVFHLAACSTVGLAAANELNAAEINIKGTYNLLHVCKDIKSIKSFISVSTDKVFGSIEEITDSSSLFGFTHPYNATKSCGDIMAQMYSSFYDLPITIVRNGNIYGPGDLHWDRIIPRTIRLIFENKQPVTRGGSRDYIYVNDIVDGYLKLVEVRYGEQGLETVNLGARKPTETIEIINRLCFYMDREDIETTSEPMWKGELVNQHIMEGKAKQMIDWCPKFDLDAGLRSTVPWYIKYLKEIKNG